MAHSVANADQADLLKWNQERTFFQTSTRRTYFYEITKGMREIYIHIYIYCVAHHTFQNKKKQKRNKFSMYTIVAVVIIYCRCAYVIFICTYTEIVILQVIFSISILEIRNEWKSKKAIKHSNPIRMTPMLKTNEKRENDHISSNWIPVIIGRWERKEKNIYILADFAGCVVYLF